MKKIFTVLFASCALFACKNTTPGQFSGIITDASMNTVTVKSATSDTTYVFSLADTDQADANGLLLGNTITVDYIGKMMDVTPATKVATNPTYAKAIGQWTKTDSLNTEVKMGIDIMVEGKASSINMETLKFNTWELRGPADEIVIYGQSIGNDVTTDVVYTAKMAEKDGKMWLMIEGTDWVLEKAEM